MLTAAEPFLQQQLHPTVIISAFRQALEDIINIVKDEVSQPVNASNKEEMIKIINTCLGTKMLGNWWVFRGGFVLLTIRWSISRTKANAHPPTPTPTPIRQGQRPRPSAKANARPLISLTNQRITDR